MIGRDLGAYRIVEKLGEGGMGEVYRAHDARLTRDVAIKVLPASVSADADRLRRFELEARATAALNHPNILVVYDVGRVGETVYVVEELLQGQTLREALSAPIFVTRDGREIFYLAPDRTLMSVRIRTSPSFVADRPVELFQTRVAGPLGLGHRFPYAVSKDGTRFLMYVSDPNGSPPAMTVISNWEALLR